ncbi:unnamed protein product [Linum trigynum]|uniref:Uncharacterized protein n=1 Tax=Linum trigynum TaxID=586398 RepID=A0AAV2FNL1_9ROSI
MSSSKLNDLAWARIRQKIDYTLAELKREARDRGCATAAAAEETPAAGSGATPAMTRQGGAATLSPSEGVGLLCAAAGEQGEELRGALEAGSEASR